MNSWHGAIVEMTSSRRRSVSVRSSKSCRRSIVTSSRGGVMNWTCLVEPSSPSSLGTSPLTNPVRFSRSIGWHLTRTRVLTIRSLAVDVYAVGDMELLSDLTLVLAAALAGGFVAHRIGQPLIVGYIVAGVVVGPFTGGFTVAHVEGIEQLAELGVALLQIGRAHVCTPVTLLYLVCRL